MFRSKAIPKPPDIGAAARQGAAAVRAFSAEIQRLEELRIVAMTKFQEDLRRVERLISGDNSRG